jgi:antitoxin ParD1/3/4
MTTMNVSLSDQMKDWVETQVTNGQYHNASEYIRDLIRKDQAEIEKATAFRAAIEQGRKSGISSRGIDKILSDAKAKAKRSQS